MAATHKLHTPFHPASASALDVESAPAMARLLVVALGFGAASVPAFMADYSAGGWCLALLAMGLVWRFPMSSACAVLGGGAYLLATAAALVWPAELGPVGLANPEPLMRTCAWLVLLASVLSLALLDARTYQQTFRREGRPVARWRSTPSSQS